MIGWWWILAFHLSAIECSLLESFQPKDDNPVELNDFLANVLDHQNDFNYVKAVAKRYQNLRRERGWDHRSPSNNFFYRSLNNSPKKRNVHHYTTKNKRFKNFVPLKSKSGQRHRRHISSNLENIPNNKPMMIKKDTLDLTSAVHKTNKNHKHTEENSNSNNNNLYYVDLATSEKRNDNNNDKDDEKRNNDETQLSNSNSNSNEINKNVKTVEGGQQLNNNINNNNNNEGGLKMVKSEEELSDNTVDNTNYMAHRHIDDNTGFEKALAFEIEPSPQNHQKNYNSNNNVENNNNGNTDKLDENSGNFQKVKYQEEGIQKNVLANNQLENQPKNILLTNKEAGLETNQDNKMLKHLGKSFIEVDKIRRENGNNKNRREETEEDADYEFDRYQNRKLQFYDESMMDFDNDNNYNDDENWHVRNRRDFLDTLGLKNDEDYTEDNPYKDELNINNTDVNNDTNIHKSSTEKHHGGGGGCQIPGKKKTTTVATTNRPHNEIDNIKQILEEPKEAASDNTVGNFKKDKQQLVTEKRMKKKTEQFKQIEDLNEKEKRKTRQTNEIEDKILQNKDKIFKYDTGKQEEEMWTGGETHNVRQERHLGNWHKKNLQHRINKKEDTETMITSQNDEMVTTTTMMNGIDVTNITEMDVTNSTYEQVAHQMDLENEKLAQVVNGHFASKIVSTVFDEIQKKSALKTKFFSGLSRKHMNYDGNIEIDIFKGNDTEAVDEARLLLDQITKVLNKLVVNQVRRKICQRLPDDLKDYLHTIVDVKNGIEIAGYIPNAHQGDFLFSYQQEEDAASTPPFDIKKLQETLVNLEGLLLSYHNLNEDCQEKAQPVKDYIEKHVKMLRKIVACPDQNCGKEKESSRKRDTVPVFDDLVEKQLESVGLGQKNKFIPNFDINAIIKSKLTGLGKNKRAAVNGRKSEKFRRLQLAAERIRQKRENERKIGELFGGKKTKRAVEFEEPAVYSLGE